MATWQLVVLILLVVFPLSLLGDFHPHRERLDSRGVPLARPWVRQVSAPDPDAESAHDH